MDINGAFFNTNDFKLTNRKLGEGTFGQVFIAKKLSDNSEYAAKILNVDENFNGQEQMMFMRESITLHKLHHPAIVQFYGINFRSFSDPLKLEPTILTEYISHGSLRKILNDERRGLAEPEWDSTKKYISLLGVSHAMKYLHKQGILHRDLKPENILIDDDYNPKICDFGLAKFFNKSLSNSMQLTLTGAIGTPLYMAPEMFEEGEEKIHGGSGVDVFAFGILAYEIVTGKAPYYELGKITSFQLNKKVTSGYRPIFNNSVTEKMKNLILKCLSQNAMDRPSFDEIFKELSSDLTYFKENIDEDEINFYLEILNDEEEKTKNEPETIQINEQEVIRKEKLLSNERKCYFNIIKALTKKVTNLNEIEMIDDYSRSLSLLHSECESGNLDLVKYIISLKAFDIQKKDGILKYNNFYYILMI